MDNLLLSRITKDFFNLDPDVLPERDRYRLGWGGSVLTPHPKASSKEKKEVALLLALRNRLSSLFQKPRLPHLPSSPKLSSPLEFPSSPLQPLQYFCRGVIEKDPKKNPRPIPSLLIENEEMQKARPVPGNSLLFRSLCKGKGVLKKNEQGLIYLDIDDQFISMLFPYLKAQGLAKPPYFNLLWSPDGAHIPVIPPREAAFHYLGDVGEIGKTFSFEIEGLYSTEPTCWPEVEQVWFFRVKAPELENLRRAHFLPPSPGGYGFHIAVAVKLPVSVAPLPKPLPFMRINSSWISAA